MRGGDYRLSTGDAKETDGSGTVSVLVTVSVSVRGLVSVLVSEPVLGKA
jgi:hypothetical protein